MKNLEKAKEIFLSDVDEESAEDNKKLIDEWEREIMLNESFVDWQNHDISKEIVRRLKIAYKENRINQLSRLLTEQKRMELWAKEDAIEWLLQMIDFKPKEVIEEIDREIKKIIDSV